MGTQVERFQEHERSEKLGLNFDSPLAKCPGIKAYLSRIDAGFVSMRKAAVREWQGRYLKEDATITFCENTLKVKATAGFEPTEKEIERIKDDLGSVEMPENVPFPSAKDIPPKVSKALEKPNTTLTTFKTVDGKVSMHLVRRDKIDGGKTFKPFTHWSDGKTRRCEPDGLLPIWGLEQTRTALLRNWAFIHEGTKAAESWANRTTSTNPQVQKELEQHPYGQFLSQGIHIGWHGGATNPHKTDWSALKVAGVKKVFIVADNDDVGRKAVARISKNCGIQAIAVEFTNEFPVGFDLADPLPEKFWSTGNHPRFKGPKIEHLLSPASWASKSVPGPKKKKVFMPTDPFLGDWIYVSEQQFFVSREFPRIRLSREQFDQRMRRFSDVKGVSDLLLKGNLRNVETLCYEPGKPSEVILHDCRSAFNVYEPPGIEPMDHGWEPFEEFMDYFFPDENDRREVKRWMATLIAKPEVRMAFSLLLTSEKQGTGKTTLGEHIIAPLVGLQNVSFPNEQRLLSDFNDWAGNKRLAVVSEIYQGHSWKAYNALKSVMTDRKIDVNEKHRRPVTVSNWLHVVACSNEVSALKIDQGDRRWLVPKVTEIPWSRQKFSEFYPWLETGGLNAIYGWALQYGDYVQSGEHAPMTTAKQETIRASRSEAVQWAVEAVEIRQGNSEPVALSANHLHERALRETNDNWSKLSELRKALRDEGWIEHENPTAENDRVSFRGKKVMMLYNPSAARELEDLAPSAVNERLREWAEETEANWPV